MYQETVQNKKGSAWLDLVLVIVLLACIILIKRAASFFQTLPSPFNVISQAAVFVVIIAGCLLLYSRRLCSYRYTMIHHQPEEGELNAFGEAQKYPYDEGTVCFERMVGNKGRIVEMVLPEEILAIAAPDAPNSCPIAGVETKPGFFGTDMFTLLPRKTAHKLYFIRKNKLHVIFFNPTETLVNYLNEYFENKAKAAQ